MVREVTAVGEALPSLTDVGGFQLMENGKLKMENCLKYFLYQVNCMRCSFPACRHCEGD